MARTAVAGQGARVRKIRFGRPAVLAGIAALALSACNQTDKITAGVGVGALVLAQAPTQEIDQTHYVGIFDPADQIPPMVYRIRVRGQSSMLSFAKVQAGWVPAPVADSLSTNFSLFARATEGQAAPSPGLTTTEAKDIGRSDISKSIRRRLLMFGPEGFREAPSEHRFVVVAGGSPDEFFKAVDTALGDVAAARDGAGTRALRGDLLTVLADLATVRRTAEPARAELAADAKADEAKGQ